MRIVSQDAKYDFPYDKVAVCVQDNFIMVDTLNGCSDRVVAEYRSEESAMEVLDIMRTVYALSTVKRKDLISPHLVEILDRYTIYSGSACGVSSDDFAFIFPDASEFDIREKMAKSED